MGFWEHGEFCWFLRWGPVRPGAAARPHVNEVSACRIQGNGVTATVSTPGS